MGLKLATGLSLNALKDFGTELSNYDSSHLKYKYVTMTFTSSTVAYNLNPDSSLTQ